MPSSPQCNEVSLLLYVYFPPFRRLLCWIPSFIRRDSNSGEEVPSPVAGMTTVAAGNNESAFGSREIRLLASSSSKGEMINHHHQSLSAAADQTSSESTKNVTVDVHRPSSVAVVVVEGGEKNRNGGLKLELTEAQESLISPGCSKAAPEGGTKAGKIGGGGGRRRRTTTTLERKEDEESADLINSDNSTTSQGQDGTKTQLAPSSSTRCCNTERATSTSSLLETDL